MARWHAADPAQFCLKCEPTNVSKKLQAEGWCSWCLEFSAVSLVISTLITRDVYCCVLCSRHLLKCRKCSIGFARSCAGFSDELCFRCNGWTEKWEDARQVPTNTINGWCSWCINYGAHVVHRTNRIRRAVYMCCTCENRTLKCKKCVNGMTRGGEAWNNSKCSVCNNDFKDWEEMKLKKSNMSEIMCASAYIKEQLFRRSTYRNRAFKCGMIRPFLSLVSMNPDLRLKISAILGWTIIGTSEWGDPHAEAWSIINKNMIGILARTHESYESLNPIAQSCTWTDVLQRSSVHAFQKWDQQKIGHQESLKQNRLVSNSCKIIDAENEFLWRLAQTQKNCLTAIQTLELENLLQKTEVQIIVSRLKTAGIKDPDVVRLAISSVLSHFLQGGASVLTMELSAQVSVIVNSIIGSKFALSQGAAVLATSSMAFNIAGLVIIALSLMNLVFGSSHARLFPVVVHITCQRLVLAAEGINLEDIYYRDNVERRNIEIPMSSTTIASTDQYFSDEEDDIRDRLDTVSTIRRDSIDDESGSVIGSDEMFQPYDDDSGTDSDNNFELANKSPSFSSTPPTVKPSTIGEAIDHPLR